MKKLIKKIYIKSRSRLIVNKINNDNNLIKLDVCGGRFPFDKEYLNVDIQPLREVDIVADITKRIPIKNNRVKEIFSCGTLEHFKKDQFNKIVKEFYRILSPGGKVIIGVPDLNKIMKAYHEDNNDINMINQYIFGAQANEFDVHKIGFDVKNLKKWLYETGFSEVYEEKYDLPFHKPEFMMKIICIK